MPAALKVLASGCVNPKYVISFLGTPTGGTFTITLTIGVGSSAPTTQSAAITYSASLTAASVQTTLQALTGMSGVTVTGSNGGPFTVTFPASVGVCALTAVSTLTGGTNPTVSAIGSPVQTTVYTVPANTAVKIATFPITSAGGQAGPISVASVPPGASATDGTRFRVANYPLVSNDSTKITEIEGAMYDAGTVIAIASTGAVSYEITGAVVS